MREPRQTAAVFCIVFSRHHGAFKKPGVGIENGLAVYVAGSAVAQGNLDIQWLKNPRLLTRECWFVPSLYLGFFTGKWLS